jgi:hypothetical protein
MKTTQLVNLLKLYEEAKEVAYIAPLSRRRRIDEQFVEIISELAKEAEDADPETCIPSEPSKRRFVITTTRPTIPNVSKGKCSLQGDGD